MISFNVIFKLNAMSKINFQIALLCIIVIAIKITNTEIQYYQQGWGF